MSLKPCETVRVIKRQIIKYSGKIEEVQVFSAVRLTDVQLQKVKKMLEDELEKSVEVENLIDESLISGVVLRYGNNLLDASFGSCLKNLRSRMSETNPG
ncbi:MAG: F0F1 ATP synthase subunit delta [Oscillospiraceae bacterium]|jgi:F-type H+-transporting ATPase subunit delta|nr:F0F1 ATP synthase subunit delta [Oscillospiraceae bacterium]